MNVQGTALSYNNSKRYQAEMFKLGGCVGCTPLCAYCLGGILNPKPILDQVAHCLNAHFIVCLLLAWGGLKLINVGYIIMKRLDEEGKWLPLQYH